MDVKNRQPLADEAKSLVLNRLKSARGHLDHVITAVDDGKTVIDALRQIAAVRGALDATVRLALRYYLGGGFTNAVNAGELDEAVGDLVGTLTFLKSGGD